MSTVKSATTLFDIEKRCLKIGGMPAAIKMSPTYKIFSCLVFAIMFGYNLLLMVDLFLHEFKDALDSWAAFVAFFQTNLLISLFSYYREDVERLLQELEERSIKIRSREGFHNFVLKKWYTSKYVKMKAFYGGALATVGGQLTYSLILRLITSNSNDWTLSYGKISIIDIKRSPNFEIVFLFQTISVFFLIVRGITIIIILTGILDYIATQFKILQHKLLNVASTNNSEHLIRNTFDENLDPTRNYLHARLKDFVNSHVDAMELTKKFNAVFEKPIFCIFTTQLVISCIEIYRASLMPLKDIQAVRFLGEAALSLFQTFIICNAYENVKEESYRIVDAACGTDFIGRDLRFQSSLIVIMRQSQKRVQLRAGRIIDVSLITFASVARASYSAYTMLKNVA